MKAMLLNKPHTPLEWTELPDPHPGPGEIRVKVLACGVCRTDLHVVDGELPNAKSRIIPGHEIVGRIDAIGEGVTSLRVGERVGIPWLGHVDGTCPYCLDTGRTCVTIPCSPATRATAATLRRRSPMRDLRFHSARQEANSNSRLCYAPA